MEVLLIGYTNSIFENHRRPWVNIVKHPVLRCLANICILLFRTCKF